jgi:pimeloyl-ACP methyl ester carboxylesterase
MSHAIGPALIERDHVVDGLFVKEVSPALQGGPPTPLLLVHGGLHGWWAWQAWMGLLAAAGWRCFAMSLRNHTDSHRVPDATYFNLKVADYVADVEAVLDWLGEGAVLIGHSMGGIVVQKTAEKLPTDRGFMLDPTAARALWFKEIDDAAFADFHRRLVPESPGVLNDYSGGGVGVERARIACPVLAIGAEFDRTPVHRAPAIAAYYGCDCLVVAGAGRHPHQRMAAAACRGAGAAPPQLIETATEGLPRHCTSGHPPADIGRNASAPGTVEISL